VSDAFLAADAGFFVYDSGTSFLVYPDCVYGAVTHAQGFNALKAGLGGVVPFFITRVIDLYP